MKANDYQNAETTEILQLWSLLNHRIKKLMESQNEESLNLQIELNDGTYSDLRFLMRDYVDHLKHHLDQIINNQTN